MASNSGFHFFCVKQSRAPYTTKLRTSSVLRMQNTVLYLILTLFSQLLQQVQQRLVSSQWETNSSVYLPALLIIHITHTLSALHQVSRDWVRAHKRAKGEASIHLSLPVTHYWHWHHRRHTHTIQNLQWDNSRLQEELWNRKINKSWQIPMAHIIVKWCSPSFYYADIRNCG